jgi:hypothetical protein
MTTKACESLSEPSRALCFEGIGRYLQPGNAFVPSTATPGEEGLICEKLLTPSDKAACVLGVVSIMGSYGEEYQAQKVCASVSDKALQDFCYDATFQYSIHAAQTSTAQPCNKANSPPQCSSEFARYQNIYKSLPDYRFGLFGEPKS